MLCWFEDIYHVIKVMKVMFAYFFLFCLCSCENIKHITALCITVTCRSSSCLVHMAGFAGNKCLKNETATQCHSQWKYELLKLHECKMQSILHSKYKLASRYTSVLLQWYHCTLHKVYLKCKYCKLEYCIF